VIVFYGTRLYGKVDQVPGLFHVATSFFYVNFVPLFPTGSFLVFEGTQDGDGRFSGVPLGFSGKSVLFGYLRGGLLLFAIVALVGSMVELAEQRPGQPKGFPPAVWAAAGVGAILAFWASYYLSKAGPLRALDLARRAGIPPEALAEYFVDSPALAALEQARDQGTLPQDPPAPSG
jgi:hypothetical protein